MLPMLYELLKAGAKFSPHYRPVYNSDHLPMTLCALEGLGADAETLSSFRDDYAARLHTFEFNGEIAHWREGLGDRKAYGALTNWFTTALTQQPAEQLVEEVLAVTLPGVALDAFHPVIRLGYALQFDTLVKAPEELAAALAYLVITHRDISVSHNPIDLRAALSRQVTDGPIDLDTSRFGPAIQILVQEGRYPQGSAASFAELAEASLQFYQGTRNFFALHLVTSTMALREVAAHLSAENRQLALSAQTSAILASHLLLGSPDFNEIQAVPAQLDREHALKYVWSCVAEFRHYQLPAYLEEAYAFVDAELVPAWVRAGLN